jgi:hypothetical protein
MQGHDVLFDAENHRVGFAKSDCNYDDLPADSVVEMEDEDCTFLPADEGDYISAECTAEDQCTEDNAGSVVSGTEEWARVVATPAKGAGLACEAVAASTAVADATFSSCAEETATCFEARPCSCSCGDDLVEGVPKCSSLDAPPAAVDDDSAVCEDLWGSCHLTADASGCEQTKVTSVLNPVDGNCYKVRWRPPAR